MAIKIVHVGIGVRGQHWLEIVKDYPDAISVACMDPAPAALNKVAHDYPTLPRFSELHEALKHVEADAAIIATPVPLHADHALQCLEAGLAVLVEKPFAANVQEASRVIERGDALGRPTLAAQNYRFNPAERTLRQLLQQNHLGKISSVHCVARRYRVGKGTFLGEMDYPQIVDVGIHHFDSLRSILGCDAVSVAARSFNPSWSDYRHGAVTEAFIEMEHDIHVQYLGTLTSHRYSFRMWIEGEHGVLWTNRHRVLFRQRGKRLFWPLRLVSVPRGDEAPYPREGTTSLLNHLRDAILEQRVPETNGRDNLRTLAIVEAGVRSDQEQREVGIDEVLAKGEERGRGGR